MAVTYDNTLKVARMNAERTTMVTGGAATLELGTTGMATVLATFTTTSSGGSVAGAGVWTLAWSTGTVSASNNGTATAAQMKDNGGTARITALTVGTTGTDIILDNNVLASGQNVTLSSATITHA